MRGLLFVGRESRLRAQAHLFAQMGIKVVEMPGDEAVLYTYDERRGGSIMLEGDEILEYVTLFRRGEKS
ncbi:hypothetical protein [Thermoproteus tenax]|uniref:Uncharacterized protein n=1 Tax=Thermoproteus tenax (strain ATCC 35583 / DSM 2078 / JCM 9277 / NBRC 100435 / Kra 1) TaxID=768679 RepID=G4RM45_THETK|nr:hypothetical protein [Thermoproteus tenax]CCC82640.1 hypothetical protein TTX_2027 [Thermoproteus tenax Kra 1]